MIIVEFECGDFGEFKTVGNGDEEYCYRCQEWRIIVEQWKEQFHSVCTQCPYHRRHGLARVYAERSAGQHYTRTGHIVNIRYYHDAPKTAKDAVSEKSTHPTLFTLDEPPPF